jgi:hypothetical protein
MNILLVIGLPASGRHHFCLERNKTFNGVIVDDEALTKSIITGNNIVRDLLDKEQDFIYTDVTLCNSNVLNSFLDVLSVFRPYVTLKYVYFENNPRQCLINRMNPDRMPRYVDKYILQASRAYKIPKEITPLKVYNWTEIV